jgi:hypothetical protein
MSSKTAKQDNVRASKQPRSIIAGIRLAATNISQVFEKLTQLKNHGIGSKMGWRPVPNQRLAP